VREADPLRLVVASTNPVKRRAVEQGVAAAFPARTISVETVATESGVAEQPMSDTETRTGAENRAAGAVRVRPDADLYFGVEGGVEDGPLGLLAFAWVVVCGDGRIGRARSAAFVLPEAVAEKVRAGMELGLADDEVFGRTDSKRRDGAIGLLSGGALDRAGLYRPAVIAALLPFLNPALYPIEIDGRKSP
jgi:inosine/xanthosine triphosphatase